MARAGIVRFLYNQNPFYLISAAVVLFGCQSSLDVTSSFENVWLLSSILAAVTLLMAATAFLIVRFGRVWDDARSIFMVLLLMFFAISVSFDRLCITNANLAIIMLLGGFCLATLVTETLLWTLKIRFPALFRLPYYLLTGMGFAYPLLFAAHHKHYQNTDFDWLLFTFPIVAAVLSLSLLPAIRRGSEYVKDNGTPWKWPAFPWAIFVLLLVGICGRSFILCLSFETSAGMHTIFGSYFLMPLFLAVIVLLLEIATVQRNSIFQNWVLASAFLAIPLSLHWVSGTTYEKFANQLTGEFCSPLFAGAVGLALLYLYACIRRIDTRATWLSSALACFVFISPADNSFSFDHLSAWPLYALTILQVALAVKQSSTTRFVFSSVLLALAVATTSLSDFPPGVSFAIGVHVFLIALAATAVFCRDKIASRVNAIVAGIIVLLAVATCVIGVLQIVPTSWAFAETALLVTLALSSWNARRDWVMLVASLAPALVGGIMALTYALGHYGSQSEKKLVTFLLIGALCFVAGILISLLKSGLVKGLSKNFQNAIFDIKRRFVFVEKPIQKLQSD